MRTDIPADLQAHLNSRETTLCWCWKISRADGVVYGFTNHDRSLTFDGVTYEASTGFLGTEIESQLGMSVDNMDVYGAVDSSIITESDIEAGRYDDASIELYLVNWSNVSQRVIMKKGTIGEVQRGQTLFQAEVRGVSSELQQPKGRMYQYACDALVGDSRCGVNLSSSTYTATGATVAGTNGYSSLTTNSLGAYASQWFSRGKLTFTSGNNAGITREIKSHFNMDGVVTISLWDPFPYEIAPSDVFTAVAGCDKTWKTCKAKFGTGKFRGFPHIPGSSTVIEYAGNSDQNFDGGGYFVGKD